MTILLDENNFYITHVLIGGIVGGRTDITTLPPMEDKIKLKFYKYDSDNLVWVLDEIKYNKYLEEQSTIEPEKTLEEKVTSLENNSTNFEDTIDAILTSILPNI